MTVLISESERAQAAADVRAVILAAGQQATLLRAVAGEIGRASCRERV